MSGYVCHVNENIEGAVYIGRNMPRRGLRCCGLQNPFSVKDWGRELAIANYQASRIKIIEHGTRQFIDALIEARDKPLACWCRKSTTSSPACHGDVILELLDTYTDDQLRNFMKENA